MGIVSHIKEHDMLGIYGRGANHLTVGNGGQFSTLQGALDYIATQPAFVQITMHQNGQISSWAQGTSNITIPTGPGQIPLTALGQMLPLGGVDGTWFKVDGDLYYYPLEVLSGFGHGLGPEMSSAMRRIEASIVANTNVNFYRENAFVIEILDEWVTTLPAALSISADMCVTILGRGRTYLSAAFGKTAAARSGRLTFNNIFLGYSGSNSSFSSWGENTIKLELLGGAVSQSHDDFIYPGTIMGSVRAEFCRFIQAPTGQQGHFFAGAKTNGDLSIKKCIWEVQSNSMLDGDVFANLNAYLCDFQAGHRRQIIDDLSVVVRDPFGDFSPTGGNAGEIGVVGGTHQIVTGDIYINDVKVFCPDTATFNIHALMIPAQANGVKAYIDGFSVHAPNVSGAKRAVRATAGLAGASTVTFGKRNTKIDSDTVANLSYSTVQADASGTATIPAGLTTVSVAHGLGYAPNLSDVCAFPTGSWGAATKWWIGVDATNITFTCDIAPGGSGMSFSWRIS